MVVAHQLVLFYKGRMGLSSEIVELDNWRSEFWSIQTFNVFFHMNWNWHMFNNWVGLWDMHMHWHMFLMDNRYVFDN